MKRYRLLIVFEYNSIKREKIRKWFFHFRFVVDRMRSKVKATKIGKKKKWNEETVVPFLQYLWKLVGNICGISLTFIRRSQDEAWVVGFRKFRCLGGELDKSTAWKGKVWRQVEFSENRLWTPDCLPGCLPADVAIGVSLNHCPYFQPPYACRTMTRIHTLSLPPPPPTPSPSTEF